MEGFDFSAPAPAPPAGGGDALGGFDFSAAAAEPAAEAEAPACEPAADLTAMPGMDAMAGFEQAAEPAAAEPVRAAAPPCLPRAPVPATHSSLTTSSSSRLRRKSPSR